MEFIEVYTEQELDALPPESEVIDIETGLFYKDEDGKWVDQLRRYPADKPLLPAYRIIGARNP